MYTYSLFLIILIIIIILNVNQNEEFKSRRKLNQNPFKKIKKMSKSIKNIGKVFKLMFTVMQHGFKLLSNAIKMMIEISQILYLIADKGGKCYAGFKDVKTEFIDELYEIQEDLNKMTENVNKCLRLKYIFNVNYYNDCIKSIFKYKSNITYYILRFKEIFNNSKLFALEENSKYGKNKFYCRSKINSKKISKNFQYSKNCNQCFNIYGLLAKGYTQLLNVEKLMNNSEKLFVKLNKLNKKLKGFQRMFRIWGIE